MGRTSRTCSAAPPSWSTRFCVVRSRPGERKRAKRLAQQAQSGFRLFAGRSLRYLQRRHLGAPKPSAGVVSLCGAHCAVRREHGRGRYACKWSKGPFATKVEIHACDTLRKRDGLGHVRIRFYGAAKPMRLDDYAVRCQFYRAWWSATGIGHDLHRHSAVEETSRRRELVAELTRRRR
jgi:hypothetical protein